MRYFLDSYAIIEMAKGNPGYADYRGSPAVTSALNLIEVYYVLAQQGFEDLGRTCVIALATHLVEIPPKMIPTIARFRLRRKGATNQRFSYVDAIGYVYAQERGYTFLTGADEFRGLPGVEFVR